MHKNCRNSFRTSYEMARIALKKTDEKQARLFNQSMFGEPMKAGDSVWYANK